MIATWRLEFDNPDFYGWLVVACYLAAAFFCAMRARRSAKSTARIWWLLAAGLFFLGVNKQLNLQTLMIDIGRNISRRGDWYDERRLAQAIFAGVFALIGIVLLIIFRIQARDFIQANRLAFAGIIVLAAFVILRASTINHISEAMHIDLKDDKWGWIMEVSGSLLILLGARRT